MNKLGKVIVAIWLILAILCFAFGIYETILSGFSKSFMFFILGMLATVMFQFRRAMLKKTDK